MKRKIIQISMLGLALALPAVLQAEKQESPERTTRKSYDQVIRAAERLQGSTEGTREDLAKLTSELKKKLLRKKVLQQQVVRLQRDGQRMRIKYAKQPELHKQTEEIYVAKIASVKGEMQVLNKRITRLKNRAVEQKMQVQADVLYAHEPGTQKSTGSSRSWDQEYAQIANDRFQAASDLLKSSRIGNSSKH